jgi:hypothetical protein
MKFWHKILPHRRVSPCILQTKNLKPFQWGLRQTDLLRKPTMKFPFLWELKVHSQWPIITYLTPGCLKCLFNLGEVSNWLLWMDKRLHAVINNHEVWKRISTWCDFAPSNPSPYTNTELEAMPLVNLSTSLTVSTANLGPPTITSPLHVLWIKFWMIKAECAKKIVYFDVWIYAERVSWKYVGLLDKYSVIYW